MSASEAVKNAGLASLAEVSRMIDKPANTIQRWYRDEPSHFRAVVLGCAQIKKLENKMTKYKTFYANSIAGCVACSPDDLPEGGNWIVSSNADDVIGWPHDAGQDSGFYKVTNEVMIAVYAEFGIR
jgi:hypothetical protein